GAAPLHSSTAPQHSGTAAQHASTPARSAPPARLHDQHRSTTRRQFRYALRMHPNPYAAALGSRDALEALAHTPQKIRPLPANWPADRWERSYAPGKWSARRVLIHLAQTELALTTRVRFAASQDGYVAQAFNQDAWLAIDDHADGPTA